MTQKQSHLLLFASVSAGLLLILLTPRWIKNSEVGKVQVRAEQPVVAQVTASDGSVLEQSWMAPAPRPLSANSPVRHLDRVQVEAKGQIEVLTRDYKLRIVGPGEFIFESWTPGDDRAPVVIHALGGHIEPLSEGERGKVFIIRDGEMTDPKGAAVARIRGLTLSPIALTSAGTGSVTVPTGAEALSASSGAISIAGDMDSEPSGSLSNEYLDGEIAKERDQFQRCQANSLRDQHEVKGQLVVAMTISAEGKVQDLHVMTSTIQDDQLHKCVLEVFSRMKFKPFKGAPIVRSYPLTFE